MNQNQKTVQQFLLCGIAFLFFFSIYQLQAAEKETTVDKKIPVEKNSIAAVPPNQQFLHYIRQTFDENRKKDVMPKSLPEWKETRKNLYSQLAENIGLSNRKECGLVPTKIGEIKKEGYKIEKIILQTFIGIEMPVLAYVPEGKGPFPAVLCVHGHWPRAKQDPTVQSRCIGLAKLGFFVLAVDAFGAGERGIGKALGEYHGASVAAALFPSGMLLPGLQVFENKRCVDYLQRREDVIPDKIGITGASGGGNQTMYAGAMDERFKAVVPVCSVGTYRAYLGAACCYCELFPGAMSFTEEWALLSMTAPRALLVINATKDAIQFSPGEASKSIKASKNIFRFYGQKKNLKHVVFESKHDYNKEMREAMYGWMTLHLKGEGTGKPIPEPEHETLDPEELRLFPGTKRREDFKTLIQFAKERSKRLVDQKNQELNSSNWLIQKKSLKKALELKLNSRYSRNQFSSLKMEEESENQIKLTVSPERGIQIGAEYQKGKSKKLAILIDLEEKPNEKLSLLSESLSEKGWNILVPELRSTKRYKIKRDRIANAVDHNSTEWALWNGVPLLGQWVTDIRTLIDVAERLHSEPFEEIVLIGSHSGGTVAIASGVMDDRVKRIATLNMLSSFVPNAPFNDDRIGILVPGILKEVGDVSHLCGLFAPGKLYISGGHLAEGKPLNSSLLEKEYSFTRNAYDWSSKSSQIKIEPKWNPEALTGWLEE